ncbi:unnamed protein product [Amoebophrya sp. A25]|nr:unnamed protein product [Amoebophrya sp. A25]|eukprot:GSA25T00006095001.1
MWGTKQPAWYDPLLELQEKPELAAAILLAGLVVLLSARWVVTQVGGGAGGGPSSWTGGDFTPVESPHFTQSAEMEGRSVHSMIEQSPLQAQIFAARDVASLHSLFPSHGDFTDLGDFVSFMVRQVALNDPRRRDVSLANLPLNTPVQAVCGGKKSYFDVLFEALETNTVVESLNLGNTRMDQEAMGGLCRMLKSNKKTQLKSIIVENNRISKNGAFALLDALRGQQTVEEIRFLNQVGIPARCREIEEALVDTLGQNQTLYRIGWDLSDPTCRNKIDRQCMDNKSAASKRAAQKKK